jgi:hypothetical protein
VRATPFDGGELLIVGGEGHKTGTGGDTNERYARLEAWARERFPAMCPFTVVVPPLQSMYNRAP